jgi:hypothetical protein
VEETTQENIAREIEQMASRKGLDLDFKVRQLIGFVVFLHIYIQVRNAAAIRSYSCILIH